jgi:hypothetical protein
MRNDCDSQAPLAFSVFLSFSANDLFPGLSKSAVTLAEAGLFDQQSGGLRRITID